MRSRVVVGKVARIAFWLALFVLVALTLAPFEPAFAVVNDKVEHLLGFLVLAVLGLASWGRRSAVVVGVGLACLGGAIEIAQATPWIGRDGELMDWIADIAGIIIALVPAIFVRRAG